MSEIPSDLKYAATHEWARLEEDGTVTVGVTDHAQDSLGDVVFVELPETEAEILAGDEAGVVESVKAASDLFMPVDAEVIEVNEAVDTNPELLNQDPYESGWLLKVKLQDPSQLDALLKAEAYQAII